MNKNKKVLEYKRIELSAEEYTNFLKEIYKNLINKYKLNLINKITQKGSIDYNFLNQVLIDTQSLLKESGLDDFLLQYNRRAGKIITDTLAAVSDTPEMMATIDKTTITALYNFQATKLQIFLPAKITESTASLFTQYLIGNTTQKDIVNSIRQSNIGLSDDQVKTTVRSAISALQTEVTFEAANQTGLTGFLYVGPDDKITRDFCKDCLEGKHPDYKPVRFSDGDPVYDEETARALMADPDRQYNCRHVTVPI